MYQGWKVTLAGAGVNFLVGITYAWSIIAGGLTREFGWTQTQTALPYTVFIVSYSLCMVAAGRLQDKIGPRWMVAAGGLLIGGSFLISSLVLTPLGVAAFWGLLFGIGSACCFASVTPAAIKWFPPSKRGMIAGIVVTGIGVSALVLSPSLNALVQHGGVRITFVVTGLVLLLGIVFLAQFIQNPSSSRQDDPGSQQAVVTPWNHIFKQSHFYVLWVMFCITTGIGLTFTAHMHTIASTMASYEKGYVMVIVFSFFNASGRILSGILSDRLGRSKAMTLVFIVMTLSLLLILTISSPLMMGVAAMFLGLTYGGLFSLFPATTASYFGVENFGYHYGLVFTGLGAGGLFPLLAGHFYDQSGTFTLVFTGLLILCLFVILFSVYLGRQEDKIYQSNKTESF